MSMDSYELRRDEGWKTFYKNDPAFSYDDTPTAKVISYFCKRRANEPEVTLPEEYFEKVVDFDLVVNVQWLQFHLKRVLKGKRKFYGDADLYRYVVLQNYVEQCINNGFEKCILSSAEYMILVPKKKK